MQHQTPKSSITSLVLGGTFLLISTTLSAQPLQESPTFWLESGKQAIKASEQLKPSRRHAKNVILFIGDGMGISTITAARILEGQSKPGNRGGEENSLSFERFPYLALSKTYSVNQQTPDSAPTMSAMITGIKTNDGVLSVGAQVQRREKDLAKVNSFHSKTLFEQAEEHGLATGIVTTARVTDATPAACYAHSSERLWESDAQLPPDTAIKDIARQLIDFDYGNGIDVVLGGGRSMFFSHQLADVEDGDQFGNRKDRRNLIQQWQEQHPKAIYVHDRAGFEAIDVKHKGPVLGLFERSHMEYEHDRAGDKGGEPSLSDMTAKAIGLLAKNQKGYLLMVEAGRIDHAHHAGNAYRALREAIELSNAVRLAAESTDSNDTLIIVTADHSHTFTIAGYPERGNPILGLVKQPGESEFAKDKHNLPYTTLGYANGPGYRGPGERPNLSSENTAHPDFLQEASVPLAMETHAAEDVAIFARGPMAHLFHGIQEQSYIYQVMARALKFSPGE